MRRLLLLIGWFLLCGLDAQTASMDGDTIASGHSETDSLHQPRKLSWLRRVVRGFSEIDENYIEPQHYNYSVMVQMINSYDVYQLRGENGQTLTFAPSPTVKVGPYAGWRWLFFGYTVDVKNLNFSSSSRKQAIDLSLYSSQIGVDLFYRRTGSDYKIRDVKLGTHRMSSLMEGQPFDGLSVGITGFNLYYIFNHKRFSYPAAFAQSTCQKISCGSWMAGIGYTRNSLDFDYEKLQDLMNEHSVTHEEKLDSSLMFRKVKYYDYNISGGYAYNWVFARNFLFCASASLLLAYKHTAGDVGVDQGFSFSKFNVNGIGRFGLVYNNIRWYAGANAIVYANTYKTARFSANNVFGNIYVYVGYNFGLRSQYKKKK